MGAKVELDKPLFGGMFAYSSAEAGLLRTGTGWTPDLQVQGGLGLTF